MAFRAVHAQWGAIFAHLPDLGCGQAWEAVWKVRPTLLTCDECHHPMHAKTSRLGFRFFAHAPGAPKCALALETLAHHLLKLELSNAARDAGAHAEMEVRSPDGTWRADVMASDHGGAWRMALEAQLSPITAADITDRTERMRADGVASIWFSDRPRPPWLGVVPSVRLARPGDGQHLVIAEGLVKFDRDWEAVPATLVKFLRWAFARRIVAHRPRVSLDGPAFVWTAPRYIQAEAEYLTELQREIERERRIQEARTARTAAWLRKQEEMRRKNAITRATARSEAIVEVVREERPEAQVVTADEEWFAAMFKAIPDAGPEACLTLWREAVEKYRSGELAEVGSVKLFDLIQARMEALEGAPQDAAEPAEVTLLIAAPVTAGLDSCPGPPMSPGPRNGLARRLTIWLGRILGRPQESAARDQPKAPG